MGVGGEFASLGFKLKPFTSRALSPLATADILKAAGVSQDQPVLGID